MTPAERHKTITARLTEALAPDSLDVIDESEQHAGHAGAATGMSHFHVIISAPALQGLKPLDQHRKINTILADLFTHDIHALRITITPPINS